MEEDEEEGADKAAIAVGAVVAVTTEACLTWHRLWATRWMWSPENESGKETKEMNKDIKKDTKKEEQEREQEETAFVWRLWSRHALGG